MNENEKNKNAAYAIRSLLLDIYSLAERLLKRGAWVTSAGGGRETQLQELKKEYASYYALADELEGKTEENKQTPNGVVCGYIDYRITHPFHFVQYYPPKLIEDEIDRIRKQFEDLHTGPDRGVISVPHAVSSHYFNGVLSELAPKFKKWMGELPKPNPSESWEELITRAADYVYEYGIVYLWECPKLWNSNTCEVYAIEPKLVVANNDFYQIHMDNGSFVKVSKEDIHVCRWLCAVKQPDGQVISNPKKIISLVKIPNELLGLDTKCKAGLAYDGIHVDVEKVEVTQTGFDITAMASTEQPADCPQGHHKLDGKCMRDYCHCQCEKCKKDCNAV